MSPDTKFDKVTFEVADTGPGIKNTYKTFLQFHQKFSTEGLGLYLCDKIVTSMGG